MFGHTKIFLCEIMVRNQFIILCIQVLCLQEDTQYIDRAGIDGLPSLTDDF